MAHASTWLDKITSKIDITEKFISLNLNISSYLRFREVNKIKGIKIHVIQCILDVLFAVFAEVKEATITDEGQFKFW